MQESSYVQLTRYLLILRVTWWLYGFGLAVFNLVTTFSKGDYSPYMVSGTDYTLAVIAFRLICFAVILSFGSKAYLALKEAKVWVPIVLMVICVYQVIDCSYLISRDYGRSEYVDGHWYKMEFTTRVKDNIIFIACEIIFFLIFRRCYQDMKDATEHLPESAPLVKEVQPAI